MTKKQHYMTPDERQKLEALHDEGVSVARIAKRLGFCRQTIYNELRRGAYHRVANRHGYYFDETHYSAEKAKQVHAYAQTAKGRPIKIGCDRAYADYLETKIVKERYSPAAALACARRAGYQTRVCTATLYSYIEKGVFLHLTNKHLWEKSKKKKRRHKSVQRIAHPLLPSITDRPEHINLRREYGHWEMDLIIGKKKRSAVLLTLTERLSRQELIFKLPDKKAATVRSVFDRLEQSMPDFRRRFKSITTDNGSEFLEYDKLQTSIYGGARFQIYYCHSFAAWEKGGCENHNRMVRRWFPKGTDFNEVTTETIGEVLLWMNHYPRKILGWLAPSEVA